MTHSRNLSRCAVAAAGVIVAAVAACGCSLGLDDIHPSTDPDSAAAASGMADEAMGPDASTAEAMDDDSVAESITTPPPSDATSPPPADATNPQPRGDGAAPPPPTDAGRGPDTGGHPEEAGAVCKRDSDCPQSVTQCLASVCNQGTCSSPAKYGLSASQFTVPGTPLVISTTAAHPASAIAAAYPYLFVVTTAGVSVFDVTSPMEQNPQQVPINLGTVAPIVATVAVGPTVYFITTVSGPDTQAYQGLAWLDVKPGDAASLGTQADPALQIYPTLAETPTNIDSLYNVLPGANSGILLVYDSSDHGTYYPTVSTARAMATDTLVPYWNQALVTGAQLAVSSGSRLIAYTNDSQQPKFALVTAAGTPDASAGPQVTVPTPSGMQATFASAANGGVLWTSAPVNPLRARVTLLVNDATTASLLEISRVATGTYYDLEFYSSAVNPATMTVVGPPVWVDGTNLAIAFAMDHVDSAKAAAHVISVGDGGVAPVSAASIVSLGANAATLGVASSNTLVYALSPGTTSSTVFVLAPLCAPPSQ